MEIRATRDVLADWLAQTKLHPPLLREDIISRPRLLTILGDALASRPLTLISAPAGYGKTTLLAQWLGGAEEHAGKGAGEQSISPAPPHPRPPAQVAWLSLDEDDNDPARFLSALIAALQRLSPDCGVTARTFLSHASVPGQGTAERPGEAVRRVIGVLINEIVSTLPDRFVLVLDDLHLIADPTIYIALDYLIERLPPQMRLVIATRYDPPLGLARLRARGQLAELRLHDLRFTPAEEAIFVNDRLRLNLSRDDLITLQSKTEGWAAGLRLLAASLEKMPDPADRTAFLTHLAETAPYIFDFLADEVLSRQSADVRTFLLETCILSELTPTLCAAVTGREDAGAILDDLNRRNLFVIAMAEVSRGAGEQGSKGAEGQRSKGEGSPLLKYRYHALFAEFLRQRLAREMPARVTELHRRAAEAQSSPTRAIHHYFSAQMWDAAARVIEAVGQDFLRQGLLTTLEGWIRALPATILESHPRLELILGSTIMQTGDAETAQVILERALRRFETSDDETGRGETLTMLSVCALVQGNLVGSGALVLQALECPTSARTRVQLLMARALMGMFRRNWTQAQADAEEALQIAEQSRSADVFFTLAFSLKPDFAPLPGLLEKMERFCSQAAAYFEGEIGPLQLAVAECKSFLLFWRGRVDESLESAQRALAMKEQLGGHSFILGLHAAGWLAAASALKGDYTAVDRFLALFLQQAEQVALIRALVASALFLVGKCRWMEGRLDEARDIYARMCASASPFESPEGPVLRLILRGLIETAERRYPAAERTLRDAMNLEKSTPVAILYASARLALAHLYLEWNRPEDALSEVSPVLAQCEREQISGLILKEGAPVAPLLQLAVARGVHAPFATRLLEVLGVSEEPKPVRVPDTGETLSAREIEILRLIAQGDSNRTIAKQLVIGEETVKSHVAHLLRKLNATSRTHAVARARELKIIK